jgi:transposase-like protein
MKKWVPTCPECGSSNIIYEAGMITGQKYRCLKCGYMGAVALEVEIEIED